MYPKLPADVTGGYHHVLSGDDELYQFASRDGRDVVVRRTLGGASEVVYDEGDHLVKIHISDLVTGP